MVECPTHSNGCSTELLVDWLSRGNQVATISRGCSNVTEPVPCQQTNLYPSGSMYMYKEQFQIPPDVVKCDLFLTKNWSKTKILGKTQDFGKHRNLAFEI